ncbi:MAG TPA: molybdopterin molybdotransferase MoeA [Sphingomicrobium sp.]|jgi:molybdopterin molybdotransferase|nr:molybdopterin molybdotransferase MoeA [Sphingomicrobium sp.]
MISFDEAIALIAANAGPLSKEVVPLGQARARTLAEPIRAEVRSPPFDASAMDGYAVRDADLAHLPATLKIAGESFAGSPFGGPVGPGECVRIFTGAEVPAGADRVVIQEVVDRQGAKARFGESPGAARHIRSAGSDFERGEVLLDSGTRLGPRTLVAAAAADVSELCVWRRPRVTILGTGDELAEPGTARDIPGSVPESVSFGVAALASDWSVDVTSSIRLPDSLKQMESAAVAAVNDSDLVVVTGGASVGEKDFAKAMFEPVGLELIFSKVAIKPGKPIWFGRAGSALVMGLPGNPTSALVTARLFLAPLLARLSGGAVEAALQWRRVLLAAPIGGCGPRETFHRVRWTGQSVEVLSNQDSSAQKALAQAALLVRQKPNTPPLEPGDTVEVIDF